MAQTSAKLGRPPPEFISRIIRGRRLDRQYHQGRPGGRPRFPPVNWEPAKIDFATIADGSLDATILVRANGAKALGKKFFLDFAAEMNGDEGAATMPNCTSPLIDTFTTSASPPAQPT